MIVLKRESELRELSQEMGARVQYLRIETPIGEFVGLALPSEATWIENRIAFSIEDVEMALSKGMRK